MSYCNNCYTAPCSCYSSTSCATPQIDAANVIYHKSNGEISELDNLDLENGTPLELILEIIDNQIAPVLTSTILATTLTYLRTKYTVNSLTQFLVAVSTELSVLNSQVLAGEQWTTVSRPLSPTEGRKGYNLTTHHPEYFNGTSWISL